MQANEFARILSTFTDTPADVDVKRGTVVLQLRDEIIEANLVRRDGAIWIEEGGQELSGTSWVIKRIARIPLLADRILAYTPLTENFVNPSGHLLDELERIKANAETTELDAEAALRKIAGRRSIGTSSVLYLTSDAGEGKTTLINQLARKQALAYKDRTSDWLLVPIPLGGRAFLRFDELIISALVNRYRFQFLYFEAFIELVRLGAIVPAFDGFEEMFIEGSSGEAVSALGSLLGQLASDGSIVVAARKAYFEYQSFRTQARLFDAIGNNSVSFGRLGLDRWSEGQFLSYAKKRGVDNPSAIYELVGIRLGSSSHPLLTRAVLVRRLLDIATDLDDANALAAKLGSTPRDYFHQFVQAIIEREASEKWLDKEGKEGQTLLTLDQHLDLLAAIAQEMWISCTESLRHDVVDAVTDMFCEQLSQSPAFARQIKERVKTHALLIVTPGARGALSFDHEDFRQFFLGIALGRTLKLGNHEEIRSFLRVASMSPEMADEAVFTCLRSDTVSFDIVDALQTLSTAESISSFLRDNVGALVVRLLDGSSPLNLKISDMTFTSQSLAGRRLAQCEFQRCYFFPTALNLTTLNDVTFVRCKFERLETKKATVNNVRFEECEVVCVAVGEPSEEVAYRPERIVELLRDIGIAVGGNTKSKAAPKIADEDLLLLERVLRAFLRSTQVSDGVIRIRLGGRSAHFLDEIIPDLLRAGVFEEIPHHGGGTLRRFRLGVPMTRIEEILVKCSGEFQDFLRCFRNT
jgi:hypothetical protein